MNNMDRTRLARLRPDKLDDMAVKEQILVIQQTCEDVDPEIIAVVFHECDYNMQQTIARIRAQDYEDGGWQKAKANHKKKNYQSSTHNPSDQTVNGRTLSDSERSLSQRTSPTSSLRDGHRRNDHYQYPLYNHMNTGRRGYDRGRNHFIPSNSRYPSRNNPVNKSVPSTNPPISSQQIPSEILSIPKQQPSEEVAQISSPRTDENAFVDGLSQSFSFDNNQKKTSPKPRLTSAIRQQPVSMHPTVQFSTVPVDIQFGDVQWNDSVPIAVTPSNNKTFVSTISNAYDQELSSSMNTHDHQHQQEISTTQDTLSPNYVNNPTTNETDLQFLETTNQLSSSLSLIDNTMSNNLSIVPSESSSHLSDHLTGTSSPVPIQSSSHSQAPIHIPITRLPSTSAPRPLEYTSPTSQFMPNNLQQNHMGTTSSAFTPVNSLGNYPAVPRDYSYTTAWNPQSINYKTSSKATMFPTGTYQQPTAYQLPPQQQQQQIFLGTYPYPALSPTVLQVFAPVEHWPNAGYSTPLESYPYPSANYVLPYSNQQQYHPPTKYDQHTYDKEFFAHYGQSRVLNNDIAYQQQQSSTPSQMAKDTHITSKLSPTAATFSQGAPLTASPSTTTVYLNPSTFSMPNFVPSVSGSTHQDRTMPNYSMDNRDNRNGASFGSGTNNRNNYYHGQQQRTHNNNASNSTWHLQQ